MILFTVDWCKYCQVVKKFLDENPHITDVSICDVDNNMDIPIKYGVKQLPALLTSDGVLIVESKYIIDYIRIQHI